jgi:hypothetical protein
MKNLLLFSAFTFLISCSHNFKNHELASQHLKRIDSLISIQNERLFQEFIRDYASNPAISRKAYVKCAKVYDFVRETEIVLLSDSILNKNNIPISDFLLSLYPEFDKLNFDEEIFKPLKVKYLQYWIDKNPQNPLSKDEALSVVIDLKMFSYELMSQVYYNLRVHDFNFNSLKPIIIEDSKTIKVGDNYEAKICFTAFDTTRHPIVKVNNVELEIQNGYGIYRYHANKPGKKTFKGQIIFPRNNWDMVEYPFEHSFTVN